VRIYSNEISNNYDLDHTSSAAPLAGGARKSIRSASGL
jgi:hypothetical protein